VELKVLIEMAEKVSISQKLHEPFDNVASVVNLKNSKVMLLVLLKY
jgi:hypothetical protein